MAYSDNPVTLRKMQDDIAPLLEGVDSCEWRVTPGYARSYAWKIRNALRLARELGIITWDYKISPRVKDNRVLAEKKEPLLAERVEARFAGDSPVRRARVDVRPVGTTDWLEHIQKMWQDRGGAEKVYIPLVRLTHEQLEVLWQHTSEEGIIFFKDDEGRLTLMPLEGHEEEAEYAWSPMDDD